MRMIKSFLTDDGGATAIEYALICSLVALALVVSLTALGTRLSGEFSQVSVALNKLAASQTSQRRLHRRLSAQTITV